jgi:hypothetical protein
MIWARAEFLADQQRQATQSANRPGLQPWRSPEKGVPRFHWRPQAISLVHHSQPIPHYLLLISSLLLISLLLISTVHHRLTQAAKLCTFPPPIVHRFNTTVSIQRNMNRYSNFLIPVKPVSSITGMVLRRGLICIELGLAAIALSWAGVARAELQPASTAPAELVQTLDAIDEAAGNQDVEGVMNYISPDFTHEDGLDADSFEAALEAFWERFDSLSYSTEILGWQAEGNEWVAETRTTILGTDPVGSRTGQLRAVIESRQEFSEAQLVSQSILREESELTLGDNSPNLDVNLPEKVGVGQSFSFDAIVLEPLGDRILLGSAYDEPVSVEGYTTPAIIDLDLLSAGGLFKIGRAPAELGDRWISAIIVREDGITAITRRLQIVSPDEVPGEFQAE